MTEPTDQQPGRDAYKPASFESKWQTKWEADGLHRASDDHSKPKFYMLEFFPYPSGDGLSVGHSKNYVPCDVYSRFKRMKGFNVLHPMGWDAFGLPAENEAIKKQVHPHEKTQENIANYKRQMNLQGLSYDWSREINSSAPAYYRWTQWFFLMMYERGLAYKAVGLQWWCPQCQTILANEQVENGGYCWRHPEQLVERKELEQWYFKITEYAQRLLDDLDGLNWSDAIIAMQRNWIGRSEGAEIEFDATDNQGQSVPIKVFTTRPDTIFGATFLVLSPEHPAVERLTSAECRTEVEDYRAKAMLINEIDRLSTDREKTGVASGCDAVNPFTNQRIPIWIADYVLVSYGTGAIMAVPGHDERDHEFATKLGLPIVEVIQSPADAATGDAAATVYTGDGPMINSGEFTGCDSREGRTKIIASARHRGIGGAKITFRLRDWLVSRQRYWGAPIPIVYCERCGVVPIPADRLPVILPHMEKYEPAGDGRSPLATVPEFVNTTCPTCGGPATRETDTLDTFVDSSWYFLRYVSPHDNDAPFERAAADYWAPLDLYVGGAEHAVMHLLYFRFFTKVMFDAGIVNFQEPAPSLRNQGSMAGPDGRRMSKSRGNVVTPDAIVERFSADTLRAYIVFMGPFEAGADWSDQNINGVWRWLHRVWDLALPTDDSKSATADPAAEDAVRRATHRAIKKAGEDLEDFHFNTVVSTLMEFTKVLQKHRPAVAGSDAWTEAIDALLHMMAPLTPYIAEELWYRRGHSESIHRESWPEYDPAFIAEATVKIVIQVNGKVRDTIEFPAGTDQKTIEAAARESTHVTRLLHGIEVRKAIFVPDRLLNLVV